MGADSRSTLSASRSGGRGLTVTTEETRMQELGLHLDETLKMMIHVFEHRVTVEALLDR